VTKVVAVGENIYKIEELRQTGKVSLIYMNQQWRPLWESMKKAVNEWSAWLVAGRDNRAASTD
jgi:hypothetical protein